MREDGWGWGWGGVRRRWDDEVSGWLISDFPGGVSGPFYVYY